MSLIPDEIMASIFNYVDFVTFYTKIKLVCKRFYVLSEQPFVKKERECKNCFLDMKKKLNSKRKRLKEIVYEIENYDEVWGRIKPDRFKISLRTLKTRKFEYLIDINKFKVSLTFSVSLGLKKINGKYLCKNCYMKCIKCLKFIEKRTKKYITIRESWENFDEKKYCDYCFPGKIKYLNF